ncbi:MAG: metallophosphoesterase family protein [Chloroflexi bacterium]|nr:metallophosphoesterase family protein [Chloroflexota bacterium]
MQIGIISDVHADYDTLEDVLARFEKHHNVDQVLCAGDLVGRGPEPDRVVDLIRAHGIPVSRGNHDEWVYGIRRDNRQYLQELPLDWQGELAGATVYMCHGKPGNNMWGMYKNHLSKTYLKMVLNSLKADVLITGHTHLPLHIKTQHGCLVNPGSLYTFRCTRSTSHTYGVLSLPDQTFRVYDANASCGEPPIEIV